MKNKIKYICKILITLTLFHVSLAYAYCPYGTFISGYVHQFDWFPQQVCNVFGCQNVPTRIPCQHPIWNCR